MVRLVDWTRPARTDVKKLSKRDADRVRVAVRRLADSGHGDVKRLRGGSPSTHRLRVGSWRVMIKLQPDTIRIMRVRHRREAYRGSYWARQEVPDQGDVAEGESVEISGEISK